MEDKKNQTKEYLETLHYIQKQLEEADEIIAGTRKGYTQEEMLEMLEKEGL